MIKTILFIDDDLIALSIAELMLKDLGYNVTIASGGKEGLQKLEQQTFDLIFLDLMMPDIYGLDVLKCIKEHLNPNVKAIPVILQTGANTLDDAQADLDNGLLHAVIKKPYDKKDLQEIIVKLFTD